MIREIINFTKNLIADMPKVTLMKLEPQKGLYVFVDFNDKGEWTNRELKKGIDFDFYDGKNKDIRMWNECIRYQEATNYISMNKVKAFDSKQKIHSCSPFAIVYNFNYSETDKKSIGLKSDKKLSDEEKNEIENKTREERKKTIKERKEEYKKNLYLYIESFKRTLKRILFQMIMHFLIAHN
jgi:predicted transcriptional regulator